MQSDLKPASVKTQLKLSAKVNLKRERPLADKFRGAALGLVSTESFPSVVGTADAMLKAADVFLVGYEKTGKGLCTAIVRGGVADVRMAVEAGVEAAEKMGTYASSTLIPRPLPNLEAVLPICARFDELRQIGQGRMSNQAIGLLETRGFPAMVGAADAMTKAADIKLIAHETIGDGLCTILVRGSLPNVAIAIDAGMHEAERIGELHAVMVVPRPLDDLEQILPQTEELIEAEPLRIPLKLDDKEKVAVELQATEAEEMAESASLPDLQAPDLEPAPVNRQES